MRFLLWIAFTAFLTGCTTMPLPSTPPTQMPWKNREEALNRIQSWQLNGKIGVQTAQDGGSATIDWTQNQQQYTISLSGPLGTNAVRLTGRPGYVTLISANGKQASASTPEQLLAQQLGWNVPVSSLHYWIRGLPVPGVPANTQFDAYHRISDMTQQGSHIQFLSYINTNGIELPQKIFITAPNLRTKIIIYNWNTYLSH